MRKSTLTTLLVLSVISAIQAGCGGKKKANKEGDGAEPDKTKPDVVEPTKADPCAASEFVLAVGAEIANRDKPASFQAPEFKVVDGVAISLRGGGAYTLFISDYPIERESLGTTSLHPPEGKVLVTVMIAGAMPDKPQAPVAKGNVIATTPDESGRAFKLLMERGEDRYSLSRDATGKLEVLAVDETHLCVAIDYSDIEKKSVKGVLRLDVVKM